MQKLFCTRNSWSTKCESCYQSVHVWLRVAVCLCFKVNIVVDYILPQYLSRLILVPSPQSACVCWWEGKRESTLTVLYCCILFYLKLPLWQWGEYNEWGGCERENGGAAISCYLETLRPDAAAAAAMSRVDWGVVRKGVSHTNQPLMWRTTPQCYIRRQIVSHLMKPNAFCTYITSPFGIPDF